jgi:tetratricopeptide (TPR) repeat protein
MPRTGSANVVHVSVTDHRIVRRAAAGEGPKTFGAMIPGEAPFATFHRGGAADDAELERDLGIALSNVALMAQYRELAELALPRLGEATRRDRRDLEAWHAYANALMMVQRPEEAVAAAEATLAWAPKNETSLYQAASMAMAARHIDRALDYWTRLIALNPHASSFYAGQTNAHALRSQWAEAAAAAQVAVRLNPTQPEPRIALIQALLRTGERERAQREFDIVRRMDPPNLDELRRWFAK